MPIGIVAARRDRAITAGVALYAAALVVTYAVPSAIGNNITRLGVCFGVALVVALAWERRRGRILLVAAAMPLALAQWVPARQAAARRGQPLDAGRLLPPAAALPATRRDRPLARVEVVPTALHWEAAYVAPSFPLARGWERQLDTANNAIFYDPGPADAGVIPLVAVRQRRALRRAARRAARLRGARRGTARARRRARPGARLAQRPLARLLRRRGTRDRQRAGAPAQLGRRRTCVLEVTRPGAVIVRERYVDAWHVTQRPRRAQPCPRRLAARARRRRRGASICGSFSDPRAGAQPAATGSIPSPRNPCSSASITCSITRTRANRLDSAATTCQCAWGRSVWLNISSIAAV